MYITTIYIAKLNANISYITSSGDLCWRLGGRAPKARVLSAGPPPHWGVPLPRKISDFWAQIGEFWYILGATFAVELNGNWLGYWVACTWWVLGEHEAWRPPVGKLFRLLKSKRRVLVHSWVAHRNIKQEHKNMHAVQTKYLYWRLFKRNVLVCCFNQKNNKVFKRTFVLKQTHTTNWMEMRE